MVSAAVLTVSDTAFADNLLDKSGPTAADCLKARGYRILHTQIVPDDTQLIRQSITAWANDKSRPLDLIITTGGTGFGARDVTPEVLDSALSVFRIQFIHLFKAVSPLIERHAPGLVHLILSSSLKHTLFASLSRPVAGTIGTTLVVTLPGSVKAVNENLEALFVAGVLDHALDLIKGGTGASVHNALSTSSSHAQDVSRNGEQPRDHHCHHHAHGHQVPEPRAVLSHDPSHPGE